MGVAAASVSRPAATPPAPSEEERLRTATGTLGAASDTAGAVAYLAGPDTAWITGTSLAVDGGYAA